MWGFVSYAKELTFKTEVRHAFVFSCIKHLIRLTAVSTGFVSTVFTVTSAFSPPPVLSSQHEEHVSPSDGPSTAV